MSSKGLTRIWATVNGEPKRLFTVRETGKKQLIISTDAAGTVSTHLGQVSEILTFKHTVHTSEKSATGANLIHLTQEFANGSKKEAHHLTHAVRDGKFAPIYHKLVPDIRNKPTIVPHKKDTIISLGEFDPGRCTLVYGIWLSSPAAALSVPENPAYSVTKVDFRLFSLTVAYGFTETPSSSIGAMLHSATSSEERLTEEERAHRYLAGVSPGAEAEWLHRFIIHELNAVIDLRTRAPFRIEMMMQQREGISHPPMFTALPPQD